MMTSSSGSFASLDVDTLGPGIFPYLDTLTDLITLSQTGRYFRNLIFSGELHSVWNQHPLDLCIDWSCEFNCGRKKTSSLLAWRLFQFTPMGSARIHVHFTELKTLMMCISNNASRSLQRLHIRFRIDEDENMLPLMGVHFADCDPTAFTSLTDLTIYGWPTKCLTTCRSLIDLVGPHLESLQFKESSPLGLLSVIRQSCPKLKHLYIQGSQVFEEIQGFSSTTLLELSLHDIGFKLLGKLDMPNLEKFEMAGRLQPEMLWDCYEDVRRGIHALPSSLRDLQLRLESPFANFAIVEISKRFPLLEFLSLQLPDGDTLPGEISASTVNMLNTGCPNLTSLEITDGLIGFEINAFHALSDCGNLRRIKMMYEDPIVDALPHLLHQARMLEEVVFFENASEVVEEEGGEEKWQSMGDKLAKISEQFPSVLISLADHWWPW